MDLYFLPPHSRIPFYGSFLAAFDPDPIDALASTSAFLPLIGAVMRFCCCQLLRGEQVDSS